MSTTLTVDQGESEIFMVENFKGQDGTGSTARRSSLAPLYENVEEIGRGVNAGWASSKWRNIPEAFMGENESRPAADEGMIFGAQDSEIYKVLGVPSMSWLPHECYQLASGPHDFSCATIDTDTGCRRMAIGINTLKRLMAFQPPELCIGFHHEEHQFRSVHQISRTTRVAHLPIPVLGIVEAF